MLYDRVSSNVRKSWILILTFIVLVAAIGWSFGYLTGYGAWAVPVAVGISIAMTWGAYFKSDSIALAMSRARPADKPEDLQINNLLEALALGAGMPKPRLYVIEDAAPNAFATGRNPEHSAIAVTRGLIDKMNRDELEGVLAHELAHVKNRDTLVMTLAVTLVGVIVLLADWFLRALWFGGGNRDERGGGLAAPLAIIGIVLMIVAPLIAQLLQFAISRQREFLADAEAVMITRYPDGLINALNKLREDQTVVRTASKATAHLWIEAPIARHANEGASKQGAWLNRMFNTHPPLEARIAALRESTVGPAYPVNEGV
ncbi:MAG: M48 family metallopeptidase [Actinomycetota bacterium]